MSYKKIQTLTNKNKIVISINKHKKRLIEVF